MKADSPDEASSFLAIGGEPAAPDARVEELRRIEAALQRLDSGMYGMCQDCHRAVDIVRLVSWPTAQRCAMCEALSERLDQLAWQQ